MEDQANKKVATLNINYHKYSMSYSFKIIKQNNNYYNMTVKSNQNMSGIRFQKDVNKEMRMRVFFLKITFEPVVSSTLFAVH